MSDLKRQSKYEPGLVEKRSEDCENGPDDKGKAKNSMFRTFSGGYTQNMKLTIQLPLWKGAGSLEEEEDLISIVCAYELVFFVCFLLCMYVFFN